MKSLKGVTPVKPRVQTVYVFLKFLDPGFRWNDGEIHFQGAYETIKDGQSSLTGALIGGYRSLNLIPALLPAEALDSRRGFNIFPKPARPDPDMLPGGFLKFLAI